MMLLGCIDKIHSQQLGVGRAGKEEHARQNNHERIFSANDKHS